MCTSAPKAPEPPKFKDPRLKDKEYKSVAKELGIKKFNSPRDIFRVEKYMNSQKEAEYADRLDQMEETQAANRAEDIARAETQYEESKTIQQQQFDESMVAQQAALQSQLAAQAELQRRSEEASLRAQVPQMTANPSNARRVRSRTSAKQNARRASFGTSQLRVPLGISSQGVGGGSGPVKLNIGS